MLGMDVLDHNQFYEVFAKDVRDAQWLVLIHSPYLGDSRIDKLEKLFRRCINRRVRVCVFVQKPWKPDPELDRKIGRLESIGVHVSQRAGAHEKIAIIDGSVMVEGSLNICSQSNSTERMTRITARNVILDAIVRHRLNTCDACCALQPLLSQLPCFGSPQDKMAAIGKSIEQRRECLQLTQRELALRCGVTQATISKIESGKRMPNFETLDRICEQVDLVLQSVPWYALPTINEVAARALSQAAQNVIGQSIA
jgi:DNA-binding XRE family transcriptional regulator